jgi:hypothetical protein
MRRILVDHGRRKQSQKRGAGAVREELHDSVLVLTCWMREQDGLRSGGWRGFGVEFFLFLFSKTVRLGAIDYQPLPERTKSEIRSSTCHAVVGRRESETDANGRQTNDRKMMAER